MRIAAIVHSANVRLRRPITWGAIFVFGIILLSARLGAARTMRLHDFISPFLWGFGFLMFAPIPWQWTSKNSPMADIGRGLIQAIPWNALWIVGFWLLISARMDPSPPLPPPPALHETESVSNRTGAHPPYRQPPRRFLFLGGYFAFSILFGWLWAEKEKAEFREMTAKEAANAAQARALQSQMNPHVLFNAISGIAELVREDAIAAEDALINLAGLLRSILDHGAKSQAPLSAERNLVEKYLGMESIRLGRRLNVVWDWDRSVDSLLMPPLLLQPLVENAIKHGIAPNRGGGELKIISRRAGKVLELEVINSGRPLSGDPMEGVGIANLKARLALLGCQNWDFAIWIENGLTHAKLSCGWREIE